MKEGQKDVFYMAADSLDAASSAPFVERLVQRDYEVNCRFHCISLMDLHCTQLMCVLFTKSAWVLQRPSIR